jgi:hypothetical protein
MYRSLSNPATNASHPSACSPRSHRSQDEVVGQLVELFSVALAQHLPVAHVAEQPGVPTQLVIQMRRAVGLEQPAERTQGAADPAHRHARLVHRADLTGPERDVAGEYPTVVLAQVVQHRT